jgi:hypothetical protein
MNHKFSFFAELKWRNAIVAELGGASRTLYGYSLPAIYFALGSESRFEAPVQRVIGGKS